MNKFSKAVRKIAKNEGISTKEVYREMQIALEEGFNNPDPAVQAAWKRMNLPTGKPRPEDVFNHILKQMQAQ